MLRRTFTISLLLMVSAATAVIGEESVTETLPVSPPSQPTVLPTGSVTAKSFATKPMAAAAKATKGVAKTLGEITDGSKLTPAVHVNSTGLESHYGADGEAITGAANRLRSARDSVFLAPTQRAAQLKDVTKKATTKGAAKANDAIESILGTSSRRKKELPSGTGAPKVLPPGQSIAAEPKKLPTATLPSVVTRRSNEPTPATPQLAAPQLAAPQLASPQLAEPTAVASSTTSGPSLAAPQTSQPFTAKSLPTPQVKSTVAAPAQLTPPVSSGISTQVIEQMPRMAELPNTPGFSKPVELNPEVPFTDINVQPRTQPAAKQSAKKPAQVARPNQDKRTAPAKSKVQMPATKPASQASAKPAPKKKAPMVGADGKVLLSNRSPVLVVRTHGKPTIRVGRVASYYVTAANSGDLAAQDVVVSVNLPNWAELTRNHASSGMVRIEPSTNGDNVMRWSIRDLKPGAEQRLRIDMIPRASRPIELGVTWNFKSMSAMAQIEVQEPKLDLSVVGPSDIRHGETKLYTITISNPGTGDAENVVLTLLPINDGTGTAGTRDIGIIKAGTRRTIEVELTARQAGELAVRASVTGDGGLRADGEQPVRVRRPNLIVEAIGPAKKYAGTPARYTVKVTNTGDATAHDVIAVAALPMASQYVKSSNAGAYDEERGRVRWNIGSLRPGAYQSVEVTTVLMGSGSNRLDVRTAGADRLTASGNVSTEVESQADLKLSVEDPAGVISLDTEMEYEVHIVNRGTKAATNVNVVGYFSEGIEPVAVRGWKADVEVGQVMMQTIPRISPGQEMVIKVIAKAHRDGNHVFRAELDSRDPQTKLAVEEWTVFHGDDGRSSLDGPMIQQADSESGDAAPTVR